MPTEWESEGSIERREWMALHRERQERRRREEALWDKVHASATADLPDGEQDDSPTALSALVCDLPIGPEFDSDEEF